MSALRWVYRRIGQIVCFVIAALCLALSALVTYDKHVPLLAAGIVFAVALVLRHQMLNSRDTLGKWWATLTPQQQQVINELLARKA